MDRTVLSAPVSRVCTAAMILLRAALVTRSIFVCPATMAFTSGEAVPCYAVLDASVLRNGQLRQCKNMFPRDSHEHIRVARLL